MKKYSFEFARYKVKGHGHNDCGICSGNIKSNKKARQKSKTEIKKQLEE